MRDNYIPYFCLGELVDFLEGNSNKTLKVGFSYPHSYRGYYEQLSFEPTEKPQSVSDALVVVKRCIGLTFQGYKGGDYVMDENTECWFSFYGESGGQQIGHLLMKLLIDDG